MEMSRREFGALAAGGLAAASLGGCAAFAGGISVTASGITEGLISAIAYGAIAESAEWAEPWAKERLKNLWTWMAEEGFDLSTPQLGQVIAGNQALLVRMNSSGNRCVGVTTDDASLFNSIYGVPYVIAASEMAKYLAKKNPSMTREGIADAILPVEDFPGVEASDLSDGAFAAWKTRAGTMLVDFNPSDGFKCRVQDGNRNIVSHSFKVDYDPDS